MAELFNTRCTQGRLIITEDMIIVELGRSGSIRQQTLYRSGLTGVESKWAVMSFFGLGGGTNLTFRAGSEIIHANLVKTQIAKEIVRTLQRR